MNDPGTRDDNVRLRIEVMQSGMTKSEKKIASYVLGDPEQVPGLSMRELAERTGTSDATVLRFCRDLGFPGYREFLMGLSVSNAGTREDNRGEYTDVRPGDDLATICENVFYNAKKALEDTRDLLNLTEVQKAIDLLCSAAQIHFFGIGASGIVCADAMQKFLRIHRACFAHTEVHDMLTSAGVMDRRDVAVLLSYSGRTSDILDTFALLRERHVPVIVLTKLTRTGNLSGADVFLNLSSPEVTMRSGATSSRIAMMTVIDILFDSVVSRQYAEVSEDLKNTHLILESRKR